MRYVLANKSNSCTPAQLCLHFMQVTVCPTYTRCQAVSSGRCPCCGHAHTES